MRKTFSREEIAAVSDLLKALPKKQSALTMRQAVEAIRVDLIKTRERGYSMEELCAILKEKGLAVSVPTLRGILNGEKKPARGRTTTTGKDASASNAPATT
jgi:hypothetical protein